MVSNNRLYILASICFALVASNGATAQTNSLPFDKRIKVSEKINTAEDEGGCIVSADGKYMFFIRSMAFDKSADRHQDIFYSVRQSDGTWGAAESLGKPVNNEFDNTVGGVSADGNTVYLNNTYVTEKKMRPGLSKTTRSGSGWSIPRSLPVLYKFPTEGFFSSYVAPDESYAILSMEGDKSLGEEDLYYSKKNENGDWELPISLGNVINTKGFESTPFVSPDGRTLYFSSNGHKGLGDADIFSSTRLDEGWLNWSVPVNLGPKVNTAGFDGSFTTTLNNEAYFTSGEGSASGPGDIYAISLVPPPPPPAPVVVEAPVAVQPPPAPEPPVAAPAPEEPKVATVLFASNAYKVTPAMAKEISKVASVLRKSKGTSVDVMGHADSFGEEEYNQTLSEMRSEEVKKALQKRGIAAKRINVKGYGELNPVGNNDTPEGRSQNRRVEFYLFKDKK